ncbi:MAG: DUF1643 domain-containing protein [Thiobacillus sp.]|uniref:DUF1643 domain-containing protein n=1 Tax=Thiobacillus sp. TaxID=924 RepID=UPI0027353722|nr:DUF1643 domain-containing protein [Thiobacillus sp.]MDP3586060.1 DUF1643 domain-containing protein [Thiobacillus sp.]
MYDIYSNARDDAWRFTLGQSGQRKLLTIGLNPSTATREKSDPTVARVKKVAQNNGFDGFVMLNLYPVRATDYRTLPSQVDKDAFTENLRRIEAVVAAEERPKVWAAWGESVLHHDFFVHACIELVSRLEEYEVSWLRFGDMTASGHPRHPSRLSYSWQFSPLEVARYASTLP